jgi:predicted type IV restriction endonuclease
VLEQFKGFLKRSYNQFINDTINERLKSALNNQQQQEIKEETVEENTIEEIKVITTQEELEAFHIVRSLLRQKISAGRIVLRDTQSYLGILLDDNNRKPLCRIHLNGKKKFISLFDRENEEKIEIAGLDDIYNYGDQLLKTALKYEPVQIIEKSTPAQI